MHLIDGERGIGRVTRGARAHPFGIAPVEWLRARDHRSGRGRRFGLLRDRIGLLGDADAAGADDVELVARAFGDAWDEQFPDTGTVAQPHRMTARIPRIEIADDRDPARVRRPHRKASAAYAVNRHHIGAERLGELEVPSLVEQMQVDIAKRWTE